MKVTLVLSGVTQTHFHPARRMRYGRIDAR
jgi:hypothetical protein